MCRHFVKENKKKEKAVNHLPVTHSTRCDWLVHRSANGWMGGWMDPFSRAFFVCLTLGSPCV